MAEDSFSLDSLLEDLEAVHAAPQNSNLGANNGTVKFVPHPPARDKQASQVGFFSVQLYTFGDTFDNSTLFNTLFLH